MDSMLEQVFKCELRSGNMLYITRTFSMFNDVNELLVVHILDIDTKSVSRNADDYEEAKLIAERLAKLLENSEVLGHLLRAAKGLLAGDEYSIEVNGRDLKILRGIELDIVNNYKDKIDREISEESGET